MNAPKMTVIDYIDTDPDYVSVKLNQADCTYVSSHPAPVAEWMTDDQIREAIDLSLEGLDDKGWDSVEVFGRTINNAI